MLTCLNPVDYLFISDANDVLRTATVRDNRDVTTSFEHITLMRAHPLLKQIQPV